jgi:hypothetical protein
MSGITNGRFTAHYDSERASIGPVVFTPGEVSKITGLLAVARGLEGYKSLPPQITHTPFEIRFGPDEHILIRLDEKKGISFTFKEIDTLINLFTAAQQAVTSAQQLAPKARYAGPASRSTPDTFEGLR